METVCSHWAGKEFDGYPVLPVVVSCFGESKQEEASQQDATASFNPASLTALKADPSLIAARKEYRLMMKHIDRRSHFLAFVKCSHCTHQPVRSEKAMSPVHSSGGIIFMPTPDPNHPGHFKTFLQRVQGQLPSASLQKSLKLFYHAISHQRCRFHVIVASMSCSQQPTGHGTRS